MMSADAIKELRTDATVREARLSINDALNGMAVVALPDDYAIHGLEKFLPTRMRARGAMTTSSIRDFASYVAAHSDIGATVFVDQDRMAATAVLNLGDPANPGHADDTATMTARRTAAYAALLAAVATPLKQAAAAEFLEDWRDTLLCFINDGELLPTARAVAAVRRVTIESMRKVENSEGQLSASRSAFENIQATSGEAPLPSAIHFTCAPYHGLAERTFVLRFGVQTGGDKPTIVLRIAAAEQHAEEMAAELALLVGEAVGADIPCLLGAYRAGA